VKYDTLRVILSFVAAHNLEVSQLDVKTAFPSGHLEEEIYLQQPKGFVFAGQEDSICRLHKCLYGLKQASRVWNNTFNTLLKKFRLRPSTFANPCLYLRHDQVDFVSVAIWVGDGLVCSSNSDRLRSDNKAKGMPYREAVGSLMYMTLALRLDITFSFGKISQFCENPGVGHWAAVLRIFGYLKETLNYGICYGSTTIGFKGYFNSDYACDPDSCRSTTGFLFFLHGGPVAWSSRRQSCVALPTTELELVAKNQV